MEQFFNVLEISSYIVSVFGIFICLWMYLGYRRRDKGLPDFKYFPIFHHNDEKILCAAIHYDNGLHYPHMDCYGIDSGFVLCGYRHCNIISVLPTNPRSKTALERSKTLNSECSYGYPSMTDDKAIQGFVTSTGRFVDREEAAKIAIDARQVKCKNIGKKLFSEYLY